jgi:hypothetical protein
MRRFNPSISNRSCTRTVGGSSLLKPQVKELATGSAGNNGANIASIDVGPVVPYLCAQHIKQLLLSTAAGELEVGAPRCSNQHPVPDVLRLQDNTRVVPVLWNSADALLPPCRASVHPHINAPRSV